MHSQYHGTNLQLQRNLLRIPISQASTQTVLFSERPGPGQVLELQQHPLGRPVQLRLERRDLVCECCLLLLAGRFGAGLGSGRRVLLAFSRLLSVGLALALGLAFRAFSVQSRRLITRTNKLRAATSTTSSCLKAKASVFSSAGLLSSSAGGTGAS